jgi:voltage-gated potassium channel
VSAVASRGTTVRVELPGVEPGPLRRILWRVALALGLITFVALLTYLGRDGYVDPEDNEVSLLDAFYYSTVSITTTGYGDIRPVSDSARLITTVLVTPARVVFLILLVGTTLELLAERSRQAYRRSRWRRNLNGHVIICGYGTKGKSAVRTLIGKGMSREQIVVLDVSAEARARATAQGLAAVAGSATSTEALYEAGVGQASSVVVAVDRDDAAVLATLTARELNSEATIVAAVREEENVHLLHQSGASSVITSSGAAGRLLGHAVHEPRVTEVLEDLLSVGEGLDIAHRPVEESEMGPLSALKIEGGIVVGVIRDDELIRFDDPRANELRPGDQVVYLHSHRQICPVRPA